MGQTLVIVDGRGIYSQLKNVVDNLVHTWMLPGDEAHERLYDWLVVEGFKRALQIEVPYHIPLNRLLHDDLYKCIFDHVGVMVTNAVMDLIHSSKLGFMQCARVKMIVTYDDIVLVKTY